MELQSCKVGEVRRYCVARYVMDDISVKVCGLPQNHCPFHLMFTANCFTLLNPMWTQPAAEKHFTEVKVSGISFPIWGKKVYSMYKKSFYERGNVWFFVEAFVHPEENDFLAQTNQ